MGKRLLAALFSALCFAGSLAFGQTYWDADGQGYRMRVGSSVFGYRNNGLSYNYMRAGNLQTYSDNTGTTGMRMYMSGGRYDSYSNPRTGQSSSGFYPYQNQQFGWQTTRTQSRYFQPLPALPQLQVPEPPPPTIGTSYRWDYAP